MGKGFALIHVTNNYIALLPVSYGITLNYPKIGSIGVLMAELDKHEKNYRESIWWST